VLERVLPAAVTVVSTREEIDAPLFPEEEEIVARAVEKRRREFTTARACARRALVDLGLAATAIPSGPRGEPQWPPGVVGSITHCDGYRACAIADRGEFAALGVDAEIDSPLPPGVLREIALPAERELLAALARREPGPSWDRLLFSAKECVYKAWFPLAGRWLGFEDAMVTIDLLQRRFSARLLVPGPIVDGREVRGFSGRWSVGDGIVVAAIALPTNPWRAAESSHLGMER
jgi:4'-phosphopantetheinyl transferase EntD